MALSPDLLPALHHFAAVVRHGSFRAAARALNLSPSAMSHAVAMLERRLGVALLNRTTRSIALTPEGRALLDGLAPALAQIDESVEAATALSRTVAGSLRIAAPRSVSSFLLLPLIKAFREQYADVSVEIHVDDSLQNIVAEGFDFGMRFGDVLEPDMIATAIGPETRVLLIASPDYLRAHGIPESPDDLSHHRCIGRRFPSGALFGWSFIKGEEQRTITPASMLILNDDLLIRQAVKDGIGIGFSFAESVQDDLAAGRLVEILSDWADGPERCYLYWPRSPVMRPAMRAFIDFARRFGAFQHSTEKNMK